MEQIIDPSTIDVDLMKNGKINQFMTTEEKRHLKTVKMNVKSYGAIGDGKSHKIKDVFPDVSINEVQSLHSMATLEDEVDWYILQKLINDNKDNTNASIYIPNGTYLISKPIKMFNDTGTSISIIGENDTNTILKAYNFSGDISITLNRNPEGNINVRTKVLLLMCDSMVKPRVENIFLDGNYQVDDVFYTYSNTLMFLGHCKIARGNKRGIVLDRNTCMFNIDNIYVTQNKEYGIYVYDDCTGSKINMSVIEYNGTNLFIRNSTHITLDTCTFQMFSRRGNVELCGSAIIVFNNCYWEGGTNTFECNGDVISNPYIDTFDLLIGTYVVSDTMKFPTINTVINGGYLHGISTSKDKNGKTHFNKYGIIDYSVSTSIWGLEVQSRYYGDECYKNDQEAWYYSLHEMNAVNISVTNLGNRKIYTKNYSFIQENRASGLADDKLIRMKTIKTEEVRFPAIAPKGYFMDGVVYNDQNESNLKYSCNGVYWDLLKIIRSDNPPTSGNFMDGDIVINTNTVNGQPFGWIKKGDKWVIISYIGRSNISSNGSPSAIGLIPELIGQQYIDKVAKKIYIAVGVNSYDDWKLIN